MGQARRRGTFEERKAAAVARQGYDRQEARRQWDEEHDRKEAAYKRGPNHHAALVIATALASIGWGPSR